MNNKKSRVFCAGTFDGLHPGHLKFLKYALKFGSELWVVVARDASALKIRGYPPLFSEKERLELVASLKIVHKAVLGSSGNWFESVKKISPQVIVLGHDQKVNLLKLKQFLAQEDMKTIIVRAPQFERKRLRTSRMREERKGFEKSI